LRSKSHRSGYVGTAVIFLFAAFASLYFLSFPDLRFHRDIVNRMKDMKIQSHEIVNVPDVDNALSCAILSMSVSESTIGLSFDEYRINRKSQDYSKKLEKALISSQWDFMSRSLGGMFMPISNREHSALVPYLSNQIEKGYATPAVFVVSGGQGDLRRAWNYIGNSLASQVNISYLEFLW